MTKRELRKQLIAIRTSVGTATFYNMCNALRDLLLELAAPVEEELNKSEPQRPEYETPSFKENPGDEQIKSDDHRPQRWPEYETPSFKESVDASVCPMCGETLDKDEKHSCWFCHRCRMHF